MGAAAVAASDLQEPIEFLDLKHGNRVQLSITGHSMGTALIHPTAITPRQIRLYMMQNGLTEPPTPGTPISVRIPVLRVFGQRLDEASPLHYWDISSKRLQAQLYTRLQFQGGAPLIVTLTAHGYKPTKVYSLEVG